MKWILRIIGVIGPFVFGTWLSTLSFRKETKTISWIFCSIISIFFIGEIIVDLYHQKKEKKREKEKDRIDDYVINKLGRIELLQSGLPATYINGLGEHPDLKHFLKEGEEYKAKNEYINAINKYKNCLDHPKATADNKVAASILIGNCYFDLSNLSEALNYYKNALMISRKLEEITDRLIGRSAALGNVGIVYLEMGNTEDALRYLQDALKIERKIGNELGIARGLGNIGIAYGKMEKAEDALRYFQDSLEIHRKIGHEIGVANQLGNIGIIYGKMEKAEDALKYHEDALIIFKKIGASHLIKKTEEDINSIQKVIKK